jgi:hypothetical protein
LGNAGNDSLLPWSSTSQENSIVSIDGGDGYDRVYLKNEASAYSLSSINCSSSYCLKSNAREGKLNLSNVEQLVFKNSIQTLNQ